jgi:hypothetical protein
VLRLASGHHREQPRSQLIGGELGVVWTRVAGLVLSLVLLSGCSQQSSATEDLISALNETYSAIASSILAIELYDQQLSTQAVTDTVLGDMAK